MILKVICPSVFWELGKNVSKRQKPIFWPSSGLHWPISWRPGPSNNKFLSSISTYIRLKRAKWHIFSVMSERNLCSGGSMTESVVNPMYTQLHLGYKWTNAHVHPTSSRIQMNKCTNRIYSFTARKNFSRRYCFALCLFFFFSFMFVALSLERFEGSQPKFHTRWRGGLARTLLKMCVIGLTLWQPSWKNSFHTIMTVHVVLV